MPSAQVHRAATTRSRAQVYRRIMRDILDEGKGVIATKPCSNCLRRKKTCLLHVVDRLGRCLDCIRVVIWEMKVGDCARSRGVTDEQFASRPSHPFVVAVRQRVAAKQPAMNGGSGEEFVSPSRRAMYLAKEALEQVRFLRSRRQCIFSPRHTRDGYSK